MHAILAVDPADPPARRSATPTTRRSGAGQVMHIVMFKAPDCVEINQ